ncbi:hypothetical protein ACFLVJ_01670 [Chloroflexota bacterium]
MKNQYFGDNKDLFSYDLIYRIMRDGLVSHFSFIPMLTEPDANSYGGKTDRNKAKVGAKNIELVNFLDECIREGKRDIKQLENFFDGYGIDMTIYPESEGHFSHRHRREYFALIKDELLNKSLIFVDPDNGLEVARSREQHLLFDEVRHLYDRMDESSILMLFQHFPREDHHEYLHRRSEELAELVSGEDPVCIDDDEIIFFFLTKTESLEHELTHLIQDYAESYS